MAHRVAGGEAEFERSRSVHGRCPSKGERTDRGRDPPFQEAVRKSRHPLRTPQTRTFREAERSAQEESAGRQEALSTAHDARGRLSEPMRRAGAERRLT